MVTNMMANVVIIADKRLISLKTHEKRTRVFRKGEDMRLIDADALIEKLKRTSVFECVRNSADKNVFEIIAEQPTAYNVEKVVAELEQQAEQYRNRGFEHEQKGFSVLADKYYGKQCSYLHTIDIVKKGGAE